MSKKDVVKLTLTRDLPDGGTEAVQVAIKKLKFRHFNRTLSQVSTILETVDQNPDFRGVFSEMFFGSRFDRSLLEAAGTPEAEIVRQEENWKAERDMRYMTGIYNSFRVILSELPDQGLQLLAQMANIDLDLMYDQDLETGFDVLDAVLEVNDIEELYTRGKQSLGLVTKAFAFMNPNKPETVTLGPVSVKQP